MKYLMAIVFSGIPALVAFLVGWLMVDAKLGGILGICMFGFGLDVCLCGNDIRCDYVDGGLIVKRRRFAWLPVNLYGRRDGTLKQVGRRIWLKPVIEMDTLWNGWTAFEDDNRAAAAIGEQKGKGL